MTSELEIGGRVRKLCFSKMGFSKYLNNVTESPLTNGQIEDTFKSSENIIWAGLMCQCLVDRVEPDFTKEDIEKWLPLVEISDFKEVMKQFNDAMKDKHSEVGEGLALPLPGTS